MTYQEALSDIRAAMLAYRKGEEELTNNQLEFVEQEVSMKLERTKKIKRAMEIMDGVDFAGLPIGIVSRLTGFSLGLTGTTEELKQSLIHRLEENLGFLAASRRDLEQALTILFEAWEALVAERYAEAGERAQHSINLVASSVRSCLIGITKENVRRVEAKISAGRRIFAKVKDARKMLDSAESLLRKYDVDFGTTWTGEAKVALEEIIKITKSAETEVQYSIDDAKAPFLLQVVLAVLAIIGAVSAIFSIMKFFAR